MADIISSLVWQISLYSFGLFNYFLYLGLFVRSGAFFHKSTEQEKNEFLLARDKYWNLSRSVFGLHHRFFVLRNGLQLHYFTNVAALNPSPRQSKTLVIFLHGFPDSSLSWRYIMQSSDLQENATLVAVDLPGFAGSDSFPNYGATEVLEALTEFIVAMREQYLCENDSSNGQMEVEANKVFLVGHDWGCVLGYRLAAEASCLANRFILTNGPHVPLALANKDRILTASKKMLLSCLHAPMTNFHCVSKAVYAIRPLAYQLLLFGYIAAFQLPNMMVKYLGVAGSHSFIRGANKAEHGRDKAEYDPPHSLAMTMGPGEAECQTTTDDEKSKRYGESVLARAKDSGGWFLSSTAYYRDGADFDKWEKSIATLGAFHNIEIDNENSVPMGAKFRKRRTSSASSALFSESCAGSLKAPVTILWGKKDHACSEPICLDGIGDYLTRDSQVLMLPKTNHWTPIEKDSRELFKLLLERLVRDGDIEKKDLQEIVKDKYPSAFVSIDK